MPIGFIENLSDSWPNAVSSGGVLKSDARFGGDVCELWHGACCALTVLALGGGGGA
jgi:hypothetical protein